MKKEPTYKDKVFEYLSNMKCRTVPLTELCKPKTKDKFIATVREYIDLGIRNGYCLEFNSDLTAIKKFDTILRTSIQEFKENI